MIGIRVDGNEQIASGHVMRCISIAKALRSKDMPCLFILADETPLELIKNSGFSAIVLNTKWQALEEETSRLIEVIKEYKIDKLLIDSYLVTNAYLRKLRQQTRVIYIDDLEAEAYEADLIINYSANCNSKLYQKKYADRQVAFLIGTKYAPLREEFQMPRTKPTAEVNDILITSGGSDPYHVIVGCLNEILKDEKLSACTMHVIAGKFYKDIEQLEALKNEHTNIIVYRNISNMAEVMQKADIAISAGGTTLLELCCCQLVTVSFAFADNQLNGVYAYDQKGVIETVGDIRGKEQEAIKELVDKVRVLADSYDKRRIIKEKMQGVTKGEGAMMIAEKMIALEPVK